MEVGVIYTISLSKVIFSDTHLVFFLEEVNVQLANESLFLIEQVLKQVA